MLNQKVSGFIQLEIIYKKISKKTIILFLFDKTIPSKSDFVAFAKSEKV